MVKALHSVGIEVILDVVYNHTGEGHSLGPTLCLRGIDNTAYYRLSAEDPRYYTDYTGCGNTLNTLHPRTLQLVMDSLRYWVQEMHVDGFRFDLAPALAREEYGFDRGSAFLHAVHQDPVLSHVKLIAEPWDLGEGGYQVGNFPVRWAEWNDKYRDTIRRFWRGDTGQLRELGYRLTGSSDLFEISGRSPPASINFVTVHDGFTLHDLVSYNDKHNMANGEDNRDGSNDNWSWNCGVEGPTDDPVILALRAKQQRNFLATLFFSQGVPMLCAGVEVGHTQHGNNNPYCQDNAVNWLNWSLSPTQQDLWQFTRTVSAIFHRHPVFQRRRFLQGRSTGSAQLKDLTWVRPDGEEMSEEDWDAPEARCCGLQLAGDAIEERGPHGERSVDDTFLLLLNAQEVTVPFVLPTDPNLLSWELIVCTDGPLINPPFPTLRRQEPYALPAQSLTLLRRRTAASLDHA
jgi:glycogen operon protein